MLLEKVGALIRIKRFWSKKMAVNEIRKRPSSLVQEVCTTFVEIASRSSAHGVPSLVAKSVHAIVKLVWLMFLVSSWGYMIFQISNSFMLYYRNSVVSSTSILYEAPTDFFGKKKTLCLKNLNTKSFFNRVF